MSSFFWKFLRLRRLLFNMYLIRSLFIHRILMKNMSNLFSVSRGPIPHFSTELI